MVVVTGRGLLLMGREGQPVMGEGHCCPAMLGGGVLPVLMLWPWSLAVGTATLGGGSTARGDLSPLGTHCMGRGLVMHVLPVGPGHGAGASGGLSC